MSVPNQKIDISYLTNLITDDDNFMNEAMQTLLNTVDEFNAQKVYKIVRTVANNDNKKSKNIKDDWDGIYKNFLVETTKTLSKALNNYQAAKRNYEKKQPAKNIQRTERQSMTRKINDPNRHVFQRTSLRFRRSIRNSFASVNANLQRKGILNVNNHKHVIMRQCFMDLRVAFYDYLLKTLMLKTFETTRADVFSILDAVNETNSGKMSVATNNLLTLKPDYQQTENDGDDDDDQVNSLPNVSLEMANNDTRRSSFDDT
jgi:hypothetical protein